MFKRRKTNQCGPFYVRDFYEFITVMTQLTIRDLLDRSPNRNTAMLALVNEYRGG